MLTKDIVVGETYAITDRDNPDNLARFRVLSVTSTRTGVGPSNITVKVKGWIVEDKASMDPYSLDPACLLGPYAQFKELKAKQDKEAKERKTKHEKAQALAKEATEMLADLLNAPDLIEKRYWSTSVTVYEQHMEGLVLLLKILKRDLDTARAFNEPVGTISVGESQDRQP